MALIKCPECGKEISDKADVCIHCGCPIGTEKSNSNDNSDSEFFIMYKVETSNLGRLSNRKDWCITGRTNGVALENGTMVEMFDENMRSIDSLCVDQVVDYSKFINENSNTTQIEFAKNKVSIVFKNTNKDVLSYTKYVCIDGKTLTKEMCKKLSMDKEPVNQIKCPTCGSTNVNRITTGAKVTNIAMFGLLGNKRKMQFHCNNCKYNW